MRHRKIENVMTGADKVISVRADATFKQIVELLARHRISAVPVLDDRGRVLGVVSEADLLVKEASQDARYRPGRFARRRRAEAKAAGRTAAQLMSRPAITVGPDAGIVEAARLLEEHAIKRLPVVDAQRHLLGIVARRDLLRPFLRSDEQIAAEIVDEVIVGGLWADPASVGVRVCQGVANLTGQVETKSGVELIELFVRRVDGVVDVANSLTYRLDDTRIAPTEPPYRGIGAELRHRR